VSQARELLSHAQPTTALLDYMLPDGNGALLGVELYWKGSKMPVVIMTGGQLSGKEELVCQEYNFVVMRKPFLPDDIIGLLRNRLTPAAHSEPD
jgi:DNA-binding response OmpR family regulator